MSPSLAWGFAFVFEVKTFQTVCVTRIVKETPGGQLTFSVRVCKAAKGKLPELCAGEGKVLDSCAVFLCSEGQDHPVCLSHTHPMRTFKLSLFSYPNVLQVLQVFFQAGGRRGQHEH